jgi:hypothetical protein
MITLLPGFIWIMASTITTQMMPAERTESPAVPRHFAELVFVCISTSSAL